MTPPDEAPAQPPSLARLLQLECSGAATFVAAPAAGATGETYGGQLIAQALRAAGLTVEPGRQPHSVQATFLARSSAAQPLRYAVETVRDGRAQSVREVAAWQDGHEVFRLSASFASATSGPAHEPDRPTAPAPESLPDAAVVFDRADQPARAWFAQLAARFPIEIRFVGEPARIAVGRGRTVGAPIATWLRSREPLPDDELVHACAIGYFSDLMLLVSALARHGRWFGEPDVTMASLNHSLWFHRAARADDWLLYERSSFWAGQGRALTRGAIHDRHGALVASVVQEGLVRVPRADS